MTQRAKTNSFSAVVRREGGTPMLFETIPPRRDASPEKVNAWRDRIVTAVKSLPVTAVNIPEVRDESREGERTYTYVKRMKPREFGACLREALPETVDLVINRVVVYRTMEQQKDWLENSYRDWGIRNLILVGGESNRIDYPGPSVAAAAKLVTQEVNAHLPADEQWFCGAITIPSRRRSDATRDEPARLIAKAEAGIEFFTSQVIYEADSTCRLLGDYSKLCQETGAAPKRIFIAMAPILQAKHLEFVRWLGVEIPPGIEGELLADESQVGEKSLAICERHFQQIRDFNEQLSLPIPLGLNVSPLIRSGFDLGVELASRLGRL